MFDFLKWFWANISFRKWTFEGRELNNPLKVIWKLMLYPLIKISILIAAGLYYIAGERYSASELMSEWF